MSKRRHPKQSRKRVETRPDTAVIALEPQPAAEVEQPSPTVSRSTIGRWFHALAATLIVALCAGLYTWTVDFPMVFDDHTYMSQNPFFKDAGTLAYLKGFGDFARRPAEIGSDPDYACNAIMRPVAYMSFYWNHLADDFNPRWFRAVNILIHGINALLVYALASTLLGRFVKTGSLRQESVRFIALTSALFFVAHPLAIESVTYIVQRFTSLVTLFSLLALWLYFKSIEATSRRGLWALRIGSVVAMLLAMQTKECSVFVPLVAVMIDWMVFGSGLRHAVKRGLPLLLCMPLIPILIIAIASAQHGGLDLHAATNIVNSRDVPLNHWHYIVTEFTVVVHYLRKFFWPTSLNLDPEWPKYESLTEGPVLGALAVLAGFVALAWWLFRRHRGDVRFALGFASVIWFFLTLSVSSGLVPLPDFVAEHRTYPGSVGLFIFVACVLDRLRGSSRQVMRIVVPAVVVCALVGLSWRTCRRNLVWSDRESLWEDTVAKSPNKYRTWGNLGAAYSDSGKDEKAVECYREALKIEPRFQNGLLNLSNSLLRLNRPKESLDSTMELIKQDQTATSKPPVAFTLGLGLAGVGRFDEAVSVFREILKVLPQDVQTRKAIGLVYLQTGLPHRALDHFHQASAVVPDDPQLQQLVQAAETAMARKGLPR